MDERYRLVEGVPPVEDYCRLRAISGLTPRTPEAARLGLPHTVHGVHVQRDGAIVGMGRVIGDGALVFQVVDVAVDPAHQGRGLGKAIMGALVAHLRARVPAEAYVSLIADGEAHRLYAQFGFEPVAPASIGMAQWLR
ncbi:GNAT family N-acetyltransferase [Rubellimicrobium roseum]|uniref:GNAT family N-acetyltransferase n=1 Tax=Rubellimicrobium roseum TaxID=687525 RepID=A0A5C4N9L5_9RHOB|nr:GNAT family N-acetyltransferase [Rubellimicrobium roseum]TNC63900.1 GNAT family N-acetyltransferase [Rubellimicrobium roseum]